MQEDRRNILIVKIGAIGDVAMALIMLRGFEKDNITWIVGQKSAPLVEATQKIAKIIKVDEDHLLKGSIFRKIYETLHCWRNIFFKRFDLVITAHPDPRYRILTLCCFKHKHSYFDKNRDLFPASNNFHGIEYLRLIGATFKELNYNKLNLLLPDGRRLNTCKKTIAIYPGGDSSKSQKGLRKWPIECFVQVVCELEEKGFQVLLVGSLEDSWVIPYFKNTAATSYIGKTSILELIATLKSCTGIITHDGGPLHLARLAGCKICAIFGPTSPHDICDMNSNEIYIWGGDGLNCRPCYNGRTFKNCCRNICMMQVTPRQVVREVFSKWQLNCNEDSSSS
ncbi:hypothetical protein COB11_03175 [Candidatus Aerophobetes bacterium]|uniref:Glycosyltransferase family 9 protein n=1 Tax=Aerophobetes bacterium TaxID=2030807 RepID=A0A2A4YJX6_UNCAE|nr:MAG: hypothetical protein COB11_03175 [Candidatus Aerophobetes bacterium]